MENIKSKRPSKGYKFKITPNKSQESQLARVFGSCRYVYNRLLAESLEAIKNHKLNPAEFPKPEVNISAFSAKITKWRKDPETAWLADISSVPLQQASRHLVSAFTAFFRTKKGYPKFKSKHSRQSASFTVSGYRVKNNQLHLGRFEEAIDIKWSRKLPSEPNTCVVSKDPSGKYHASFICEYTASRISGKGVIGIDAGITDLAVMSNGEFIKNPRHFVKYQKRLAIAQRRHARKKKGSRNKAKSKIQVARIHEKIRNCRSDHLHQLTSRIVRENQAIAIEQLNVKGMVKNSRLAKHISDAGWSTFRNYLTYKVMETSESKLVLADPYFPSTQYCSKCQTRPESNIKLGITKWTCSHCHTTHQRDLNAAINLELYLKHLLKNWTPGTKVLLAKSVKL